MKLSRDITRFAHIFFDQVLPPFMRDSRLVMRPFLWLLLRDKTDIFIKFKDRAHTLSDEEFKRIYEETYGLIDRETDLNAACVEAIINEVSDGRVLEVGCGNGFLLGTLQSEKRTLSAVDVQISDNVRHQYPQITFYEGPVEKMSFVTETYDTVVCTHTLEHVRDLHTSLKHLRRVTRKKLIIIVPAQRPYRCTFDLHLHFFPYEFSVLQSFVPPPEATVTLEKLDGDWFYTETY